MGGLWLKEWRALRPFWFLILLLHGIDLVYIPLVAYPDQNRLLASLDWVRADNGSFFLYEFLLFLTCFALANGLLVREQDQLTIRFLDGLPTSRTRVFAVKLILAYAVLFCGPLTEVFTAVLFHSFSLTSLDATYHWPMVLTGLGLHAAQLVVCLACCLFCSFFRLFGWIFAAMGIITYLLLHRYFPEIEVINPVTLVRPVLRGMEWVIPWRALAVQLPMAAMLLLLCWLMFLNSGLRISAGISRLRNRELGRFAFGCAGVATVLAWIFLIGFLLIGQDGPDPEKVSWRDWQVNRVYAGPYLFHVPANLEDRARPMVAQAQAIHEVVRDFFEAEALSNIVVDATSRVGPHTAGLAFGKSIKLNLAALENLAASELTSTLGHETTHIYIESVSNQRMSELFRWTRFFHEGLAQYVEHRFFRPSEQLLGHRLQASLIFRRHELELEELVDNDLLTEKHDHDLVYSLGERFISALVLRYGNGAPVAVLRALGRADAPKGLSGLDLWRDSFRAAGLNFDEVANAFFDLLDRDNTELADQLEKLPRVYASIVAEPERLGIETHLEFVSDKHIICRVRQHSDVPPLEYQTPTADKEGVFWLRRIQFPTLEIQLGVLEPGSGLPCYQPWQQVTLAR